MKSTLLLLFLSFVACTEPPVPALSFKDRQVVDSLFKIRVDTLRPRYDSTCTANFAAEVRRASDSLMQVRMAEIQKHLERIKLEKPE